MADGLGYTPGTGATIATDDVGGFQYQRVKLAWGVDGVAADTSATNPLPTRGYGATVTTSATRPSDTTAYATGDAWSNSTSAPSVLTFSNVLRVSGGSSLLTSMVIITSANQIATAMLQGELWLFDTTVTAQNDNAAMSLTDAELETLVAKLPFIVDSAASSSTGASGSACTTVTGINVLVSGVSSANLFGVVRMTAAYTPVSAEKLTFRLQFMQVN